MSEILTGEIEAIRSNEYQFMIELAERAIFGALSTVLSWLLVGIITNSRIQSLNIA
ncbi:MAG: hypothetical protein ACFFCE_03055 [Promethearchaeota archaeon]